MLQIVHIVERDPLVSVAGERLGVVGASGDHPLFLFILQENSPHQLKSDIVLNLLTMHLLTGNHLHPVDFRFLVANRL
jgi:hypothetical protein